MKITDIKTYEIEGKLSEPFWWGNGGNDKRSASLVKIETDEGLTGWGEGWGGINAFKNILKDAVINNDPFEREKIWSNMFNELNNPLIYPGLGGSAMSAIDIALWDITGKKLGVPISVLLGGKVKDKVHVYATGLYYTRKDFDEEVSERIKEAKSYENKGFNAMKIKIGALELEKDLERVSKVKDSLKNDTKLFVDANQAYDLRTAKFVSDKLYEMGIFFFEEPIMGLDVQGYKELVRYSKIRISGGESLRTRYQFLDFINNKAFDIAQPDVGNVGGITEFKHVQSLAYANGIHVYPHVWGTSIMISASLQLASTFTNLPISSSPHALSQEPIMEFDQSENPIRYKISSNDPFKFEKGYLVVPELPGLGIEIDEKKLEEFIVI
tara:strand:+ start:285 stop:1433 length:1149 start_codon:yes stop_codon:yes gene_type:complete